MAKWMAGIGLAAIFAALPVAAQVAPVQPGRMIGDVRAPSAAPATLKMTRAAKRTILYLPQSTELSAAQAMATAAKRLEGWNRVTAGATLGGPELIRAGDEVWLIATGADHIIQAGRIDLNSKSVEPSSWAAISGPISYGATSCGLHQQDNGNSFFTCQTLAEGGGIRGLELTIGAEGVTYAAGGGDLVGARAGSRPAAARNGYNVSDASMKGFYELRPVKPVVWAGGAQLWLNAMDNGANLGWKAYPVDQLASGLGCDQVCAYRRTDGSAGLLQFATKLYAGEYKTVMVAEGSITPPLPNAGEIPDLVESSSNFRVVMPDTSGTLWVTTGSNSVKFYSPSDSNTWGSWVSIGGMNKAGSAPACVAYSTGFVCAIQTPDGSIYMRQIGATGGL